MILNTTDYVNMKVQDLTKEVKEENLKPLLVIIVAEDYSKASSKYVKNKHILAEKIGITIHEIKIRWNGITPQLFEKTMFDTIESLNNMPEVNGIIVQLPVPYIDPDKIAMAISPKKDVDGFHPTNLGKLMLGMECLTACTPKGISDYMDYMNIDVDGKLVCVVGRSNIVGKPLQAILTNKGATVLHCNSKTPLLSSQTYYCDVVITAIGKPKFFTEHYFSKGTTVIDVGINFDENGKLCGDVDYETVSTKVEAITPVPGGVGKTTVLALMQNTVMAYKLQNEQK